MKRISFVLAFIVCLTALEAQPLFAQDIIDSVRILHLQQSLDELQNQVLLLEKTNTSNTARINSLEQHYSRLTSTTEENRAATQQLSSDFAKSKEDFSSTTGRLSAGIDDVSDNLTNATSAIKKNSIFGLLLFFLLLILLAAAVFFFFKKLFVNNSSLSKLQAAQNELQKVQKSIQEESIKLDSKMVDILQNQITKTDSEKATSSAEPDHSLVISIVNEVARIEQNLSNMDTSVRGVSNLKNRAAAIIASLRSKGYEFPKLLGERFSDGDNMIATMELDESLPAGTQIIKRVVKPQVMYKGKMIQAADVVVAYNE